MFRLAVAVPFGQNPSPSCREDELEAVLLHLMPFLLTNAQETAMDHFDHFCFHCFASYCGLLLLGRKAW